jgi:hypothetical protein
VVLPTLVFLFQQQQQQLQTASALQTSTSGPTAVDISTATAVSALTSRASLECEIYKIVLAERKVRSLKGVATTTCYVA